MTIHEELEEEEELRPMWYVDDWDNVVELEIFEVPDPKMYYTKYGLLSVSDLFCGKDYAIDNALKMLRSERAELDTRIENLVNQKVW